MMAHMKDNSFLLSIIANDTSVPLSPFMQSHLLLIEWQLMAYFPYQLHEGVLINHANELTSSLSATVQLAANS